jgi:anti-sigma B factor antagonist
MKAMPPSREITTIALPERLDSATAPAAEKRLLDALKPNARVVIDGFAISYMSAAGVRLLATALHVAEERGVYIAFCRFEGAAADCLQVSGFAQLLDVAASLEDAVARVGGTPRFGASGRLHAQRGAG